MLGNISLSTAAMAAVKFGSQAFGEASALALNPPKSGQNDRTTASGSAVTAASVTAAGAASADATKAANGAAEAADQTGAVEAVEKVQKEAVEKPKQARLGDVWRFRFDAETLRMFTEVVDPNTRDTLYMIPPMMELSESAQREGEFLSRRERLFDEYGLVV